MQYAEADAVQCVAVCIAVRCSVLQCVAVCCNGLQYVAVTAADIDVPRWMRLSVL